MDLRRDVSSWGFLQNDFDSGLSFRAGESGFSSNCFPNGFGIVEKIERS